MRAGVAAALLVAAAICPRIALAGFTETLPAGMFLLEESFVYSFIDAMWDDDSQSAALVEPMERYEPGSGKQGVLTPNPRARYYVMITKLQYGLLDDLSLGLGIPVVVKTKVEPNFSWEPGDYQRSIGRSYSEADFWDWAESMGQPRLGTWEGNNGVLSDIVVGLRWRWTHRLPRFKELGLHSALGIYGVLPTGSPADPEEPVAVGTTLWDLHTQGDLCFHLGVEKSFTSSLDGRLRLGLEGFYQIFFDRERVAPKGTKHPLLMRQAPYVGETYTVNPGDFSGFALEVDVVPYRGPAWASWLSDDDLARAEQLPPIIALWVRYTFIHLQQSDWKSEFALWDWEKEKVWRPGYKNILTGEVVVSLFRLGWPLQVFFNYQTLSVIPGKNARGPDVISAGIRVPAKFW